LAAGDGGGGARGVYKGERVGKTRSPAREALRRGRGLLPGEVLAGGA